MSEKPKVLFSAGGSRFDENVRQELANRYQVVEAGNSKEDKAVAGQYLFTVLTVAGSEKTYRDTILIVNQQKEVTELSEAYLFSKVLDILTANSQENGETESAA